MERNAHRNLGSERGTENQIENPDIKPSWTWSSNRDKASLILQKLPRLSHFTFCEEDELVKERDDVAAQLVDDEDDPCRCSLVLAKLSTTLKHRELKS